MSRQIREYQTIDLDISDSKEDKVHFCNETPIIILTLHMWSEKQREIK